MPPRVTQAWHFPLDSKHMRSPQVTVASMTFCRRRIVSYCPGRPVQIVSETSLLFAGVCGAALKRVTTNKDEAQLVAEAAQRIAVSSDLQCVDFFFERVEVRRWLPR
jgi:hypothetical protein